MINITDKSQCCGCNACGDICPKDAITFKTDIEGFWYPEVNKDKCIDCGLCEKVCPIINVKELKKNDFKTPLCYAAHHKNLEIRFDSTSGGVFSAFAEEIYKKGGYVGGVVYNEDWSASHFISNNKEDLKRLRSSKYLQSNAEGFYNKVKEAVTTGVPVLVCGTPCQMAALRRFLRKDYDNLIILDFICHSIASPKAHRKYFDYLEEKEGSKVVYFKAKNKELGWRSLTKKSMFANGKSYYGIKDKDLYSRAYHSNMIDRLSCYHCQFKGYPRIADITLADFWGVEKVAKQLDNNTGTSAILVNSRKGEDFIQKVSKRLIIQEVKIEDIQPFNRALVQPSIRPNYNRDDFFKDLETMPFDKLGDKYFPIKGPSHKLLRTIKSIAGNVKRMTQLKPKPLWQFFYLNFLHPAIHTNWKEGHLLYPSPYCVFDIAHNANIQVHGVILCGNKKFKKSKLESRFLFDQGSKVTFKGNFRFGYGCDVEVFPHAELILGADSGGNLGLTLICGKKIQIGSHTFYGRDVSIRDHNGGHIIAQQGFKDTNPVTIGDMCWICSEAKIMPGVKIGDGTIVGSNSIVISPLPPRVLVSGSPAKIIDTDISWKH
jgi:acetyltransferase-like isoleucine patch superfamily enzyme/coenzyme F420-reducing hydrogenase beta subunit